MEGLGRGRRLLGCNQGRGQLLDLPVFRLQLTLQGGDCLLQDGQNSLILGCSNGALRMHIRMRIRMRSIGVAITQKSLVLSGFRPAPLCTPPLLRMRIRSTYGIQLPLVPLVNGLLGYAEFIGYLTDRFHSFIFPSISLAGGFGLLCNVLLHIFIKIKR